MGKAVGGGVYSVEQVATQDDTAKSGGKAAMTSSKVDLESVEFSGHMKAAVWDQLRNELAALEQKYKQLAPNLKVNKQSRKSK